MRRLTQKRLHSVYLINPIDQEENMTQSHGYAYFHLSVKFLQRGLFRLQ